MRADRERRAQLGKLRIERDVELRLVRDGLERVARALAREADADRRAQCRHAISIRPQVAERRRIRPGRLRARNRGQSEPHQRSWDHGFAGRIVTTLPARVYRTGSVAVIASSTPDRVG